MGSYSLTMESLTLLQWSLTLLQWSLTLLQCLSQILTLSCTSVLCFPIVQKHLESVNSPDVKWKLGRSKLQEVSDELMSAKIREAGMTAEMTELKQKFMELETKVSFNCEHSYCIIFVYSLPGID